jgi:hypothetical protein
MVGSFRHLYCLTSLCDVDGKPIVMFWSKGHNAYYLLGVLSVTFAPSTSYSTLLNTLISNMLLESFLIYNILFTLSPISSICIAYNEIQTLLTFLYKKWTVVINLRKSVILNHLWNLVTIELFPAINVKFNDTGKNMTMWMALIIKHITCMNSTTYAKLVMHNDSNESNHILFTMWLKFSYIHNFHPHHPCCQIF